MCDDIDHGELFEAAFSHLKRPGLRHSKQTAAVWRNKGTRLICRIITGSDTRSYIKLASIWFHLVALSDSLRNGASR